MDDFAEYAFVIRDSSPETLPMARLASYLQDLSRLFGSTDAVHFDRVTKSSACLRSRVEKSARRNVSPRIRAAALGEGPSEAIAAFRKLNEKLTEDGTTGEMHLPGGQVVVFPGVPAPERPLGPIRQRTAVQGRLVRIRRIGRHGRRWT